MIYVLILFLLLAVFLTVGWFVRAKTVQMQRSMGESFKALSFEVLEKSSRSFLDLAKLALEKSQMEAKHDLDLRQKAIEATLQPIQETLKQIDLQQRELEKKREGAYVSLTKQVDQLVLAERELRKETIQLSQSLRSPQARGSWGEVHLKRVVELAGLVNHCDFFEQKGSHIEGRAIRPDLIVHLPGEKQIVVDAKTPLNAYLDATDLGDELLRQKKLQEHAALLRKHMKELSGKEYWKQFGMTPEYVILFLPAEAFFSAALQSDPSLIEVGAAQNIIVATPTTLIAILRAIAFSWKQDLLSKNAKEMAQLGHELYERMGVLTDHWSRVGKSLNGAVDAYNQSIASLESRVLVSARKLKDCGGMNVDIHEPSPIEKLARSPKS